MVLSRSRLWNVCHPPQFIAVIDTWRTMAIDTHTKYGTWATAICRTAKRPRRSK
jgi:hypothetical protein